MGAGETISPELLKEAKRAVEESAVEGRKVPAAEGEAVKSAQRRQAAAAAAPGR